MTEFKNVVARARLIFRARLYRLVRYSWSEAWYATLALVILSSVPLLSAQTGAKIEGQKLNFEGLRVIRVEISAYPTVKESDLRPIIVQREGEPYSADKIRASIAALYATGRFHDIQVDATPEGDGVILIFVLQPTFYIGVVNVTGVEKAFPPNRVIEAANLPHQVVYTKEKLTEAIKQLDEFFKNDGFYQATIHPNLNFDDLTRRANMTFDVELNRRAQIGEVAIVGADGSEKDLRRALKLKSGSKFSSEKLERAEENLRRELAKQDFLAARIRLTKRMFQPATNNVDLTYEIQPGQQVVITTEGDKLSKKKLRRLVPVYEERTIDPDLVEEGRRDITTYYQTKGYFDAEVNFDISRNEKVTVNYAITKGEKHKLEKITFTGNTYFTDDYLLEQIPIRTGQFFSPGVFNEDLVRRSTNNIQALYRQRGFEEVQVTDNIVDREPQIDVNFQILPGPQTLVESLEVQGNRALSTAALTRRANLKPQQPFSEKLLVDDRDHILARYYSEGFPNARFDAQVERVPGNAHKVRVTYRIDEGNQVRIEQIYVTGNRTTRERYIREELKLSPGQPLSLGKLLEQESKLYNLGLFERVEIVPRQPITEQKSESLVVQVREAKRNTLSYSLGFEANRRPQNIDFRTGTQIIPERLLNANVSNNVFLSPRASLELSRRNMRGRGETATVGARVSRLLKRGVFTYTDPRFLRSDWTSLFSIFTEQNAEIRTFTARRGEASFQLERHPNPITTLFLRYSFRRVSLSDIRIPIEFLVAQDRSARLSTVSTSFIRDTRNHPLDAATGKYFTADFGVTPKIIGSRSNFIRFFGQAARYSPVFGSTVWANSFRFGIAKPFGRSEIPLSERFYAGGATTLRGFPTNEAGPQQVVRVQDQNLIVNLPIGGDLLVIVNSELRFPMPLRFLPSYKNLSAVLFYDGGNVYNKFSRGQTQGGRSENVTGLISRGYSNTLGAGLRFKTPVGPARFDIGRNFNPMPGLSRTQFFITLGQAF